MTPEELRAAAEAVHGREGRGAVARLAALLAVSERHLGDMVAGRRPIPAGLARDARRLHALEHARRALEVVRDAGERLGAPPAEVALRRDALAPEMLRAVTDALAAVGLRVVLADPDPLAPPGG